MLFSNTQELRFYFPTHAIDTLDPFIGIIDSSEHDFLLEKLGAPLYDSLCQWYARNKESIVISDDLWNGSYYSRLLGLCQRVVAYNAFSRAVDQQIISPNNAGINIPTSGDYGKVDLEAVSTFKNHCITEAHAAVNYLLHVLEGWCLEDADEVESDDKEERKEIIEKWKKSRFFFLAAGMLVPSATVLQEYLNIYGSREKFIQMLPDLRFIQEEVLAPSIGEDLCASLVQYSVTSRLTALGIKPGDENPHLSLCFMTMLKKARKYLAVALEERTTVLRTDKVRRQQAHDEAVRLLGSLQKYIADNQNLFPESVIKTSPLYTPPPAAEKESSSCPSHGHTAEEGSQFRNNQNDAAFFAVPFLN